MMLVHDGIVKTVFFYVVHFWVNKSDVILRGTFSYLLVGLVDDIIEKPLGHFTGPVLGSLQ